MQRMGTPVVISDFEKLAAEKLPRNAWNYYAAGADGEQTLSENCKAFERYYYYYFCYCYYRYQYHYLLILLCRVFTGYITGCNWNESQLWLIAQRFIALHSIPAIPNSAVVWVLAMMSSMPNISIDLMIWWFYLVLFLYVAPVTIECPLFHN